MYLGCNTPNMLREINVHFYNDFEYESLHFSAFPNAKKLTLDVVLHDDEVPDISPERMKTIASEIAKMPQLESLDPSNFNTEFVGIIASHEATNQRTKALSVELWEDDEDGNYDYDRFIETITLFKHIQFFTADIDKLADDGPPNDAQIKSLVAMCSNLKGLNCKDGHSVIELSILQSIGHLLRSLRLNNIGDIDLSPLKDINFGNLCELKQGPYCSDESLNAVLETATNLERVKLSRETGFLEDVLTKCKRLKYLEIAELIAKGKNGILNALLCALDGTKGIHRDSLTIKITAPVTGVIEQNEIHLKLSAIISSLLSSNMNQIPMIEDSREVIELFVNTAADIALVQDFHDIYDHEVVLISNPNCSIRGYTAGWLMSS